MLSDTPALRRNTFQESSRYLNTSVCRDLQEQQRDYAPSSGTLRLRQILRAKDVRDFGVTEELRRQRQFVGWSRVSGTRLPA